MKVLTSCAVAVSLLSGCAVASIASVASTAVGVAAGAVGVAADVAIGTAKVAGKAVGAAVDAATLNDAEEAAAGDKAAPRPGGPRK